MNNKCKNCGQTFRAIRTTRKYCSDNCKQLAYFKRNGMVFGMNGTNETTKDDPLNNATVKPIVKEVYPNADSVKTIDLVSVKEDQDILRLEKNENQDPVPALTEEQMQELVYRISKALDVKLEAAIVNVKEELSVKYASLYGKGDLASNTEEEVSKEEKQVQLCNPAPFVGITRQTQEPTVKDDAEINVKPNVKYENAPLPYNTENALSENSDHLPEKIMVIPLSDDEDEIQKDKKQTEETFTDQETPSIIVQDEEAEQEYKWVKSNFLTAIENDFDESYGGDVWESSDPNVIWVNERLRCVMENIVRLSEYNTVDRETITKLSDVLNRIESSYSFNNLSSEYPFLQITREVTERMNDLSREGKGDKIALRINLKTKARLVSLCYQMKDNVPLLKFNEMTFEEEHSERRIDNKPADTKSMSIKEKYKYYKSIGMIEPDDEDDDNDEEEINHSKTKRNPYFSRLDYFNKHGEWPTKAA